MNRTAPAVLLLAGVVALASAQNAPRTLKVGATPVPHAELLKLVKPELAAQGIELQIVEFTDYVTPNIALAEKQLDANFFQHIPYLESFAGERGLALESAGGIHVEPLGLYSKKYKSIAEIPQGASIGLPNDPTNEGRALILLANKGLIKLKAGAGLKATPRDIAENPKKLNFRELDAALLPRSLSDVAASVINGNYALQSGLNPVKDSLILEGAESPYVNIVAVRKGETKDPRIVALVAALKSKKVKDYILATYNGGVVPAF